MIRDNDMINVFDIERVLGDLPIDIIKENIKTQIDDPLTFMSDQCEQVYETLQEAMDEFGHIDEYRYELMEIKDDFSTFLIIELNNRFNLGIDLENLDGSEIHNLAQCCYEFFVLNLKENLSNFFINYINMNQSTIADIFIDEYKRKDVTTTNMKKFTKNRNLVLILSNIISVLNYILDIYHDPEDFMELAIEPGEYTGEYVKEAVYSFKITNNFVSNLLNEIKYSHNDIIDELASEIIINIKENISIEDLNNGDIEGEE